MHVEQRLRAILGGLLAVPGLVPPGAVLDAGANNGADSIFLSKLNPERQVVSVEPTRTNVRFIEHETRRHKCSNIEVIHAGLSNASGESSYAQEIERGAGSTQLNERTWAHNGGGERIAFNVTTVDALFEGRALALAHWDVEGMELAVIQGARRTIARDRPFFTVETFPQSSPQRYQDLMGAVVRLGYQPHEILNETCGSPRDCRNFLCVPSERLAAFRSAAAASLGSGRALDRFGDYTLQLKYSIVFSNR